MRSISTICFLFLFPIFINAQQLKWVNTFGGGKNLGFINGNEILNSCFDKQGNSYVVGYYADTIDIDPGPATELLKIYYSGGPLSSSTTPNMVVAKYNRNGNLLWHRIFYSNDISMANAVVSPQDDGSIIIGGLNSTILSDTIEPIQSFADLDLPYQFGGYLIKIDSAGNDVKRHAFGGGYNQVLKLASAPNGDVYATGTFGFDSRYNYGNGKDTLKVDEPLSSGRIYICKFDKDLNFKWVKKIEPEKGLSIFDIKVDNIGNLFTCGYSIDSLNLDMNGGQYILGSDAVEDTLMPNISFAYLAKYDSAGNIKAGFELFGGVAYNSNIAIDRYKNVILSGFSGNDIDFDPGPGTFKFGISGSTFLYVSRYDSNFKFINAFNFSSYHGNNDRIRSTTIDSVGSLIMTGSFSGVSDFDPGPGVTNLVVPGGILNNNAYGIFLAKYTKDNKLLWARSATAGGTDYGTSISMDSENNILLSGQFVGTVDFNLLGGVETRSSPLGKDGFAAKYSQCITRTQVYDTICANITKTFDGEKLTKPGKYIRLKSYNASTQCEVWEELYLHVRPELNASAGKDSTLCAGKKLTLGSDSIIKTTYNWQQIGGSFTSTKAKPNINFENNSDTLQIYKYAYQASQQGSGCQKRDTVSIKVLPRKRSVLSQAICKGQSFLGYDTAGVYVDTLFSQSGCDSIRTLTLSIKPIQTKTQTVNLCQGQSLQVGTRTYNAPGIYKDTLTAANGCDSIITSTLNYSIPNDTILLNGLNFTAADNQDSYQWLDCNQNFQAIAGATQQSFTPTSNGSYAVKTTKGNCADTSNCLLFTSGKDLIYSQIRIYPQPVKDKLYIEMPETGQTTEFVLLDALGRIVFKEKGRYIPSISVSKLPAGLYQLKIFQGNQVEVFGVMVEK